jgi:hypothetical protein
LGGLVRSVLLVSDLRSIRVARSAINALVVSP